MIELAKVQQVQDFLDNSPDQIHKKRIENMKMICTSRANSSTNFHHYFPVLHAFFMDFRSCSYTGCAPLVSKQKTTSNNFRLNKIFLMGRGESLNFRAKDNIHTCPSLMAESYYIHQLTEDQAYSSVLDWLPISLISTPLYYGSTCIMCVGQ